MNEGLVYAMDASLDHLLDRDFVGEHQAFAEATRSALGAAGLEIYARSHHANTVTTVLLPEGVSAEAILADLRRGHLILSGGIGPLKGRAIRIGHMGADIANEAEYVAMLALLSKALTEAGVELKEELDRAFLDAFRQQ